ncbi:MAG: acetyl-CoA carboxylase biotin carboxyl carrier protein subunit [Verrucomicrobia bacterium]|nr:acetyl-CoA carboxylase biotin carboxyl carrier protein subunit [Cytophagales bacterium]
MFHVTVNGHKTFEITSEKGILTCDNQVFEGDMQQIKAGVYHLIHQDISYNVQVISMDRQAKILVLKINNNLYQTSLQDTFDVLLKKMGMDKKVQATVSQINAPMPGLILAIKAVENQEVKKGDTLLILEAMKMENLIKAPADGIIKSIIVQEGNNVEKGQTLIYL